MIRLFISTKGFSGCIVRRADCDLVLLLGSNQPDHRPHFQRIRSCWVDFVRNRNRGGFRRNLWRRHCSIDCRLCRPALRHSKHTLFGPYRRDTRTHRLSILEGNRPEKNPARHDLTWNDRYYWLLLPSSECKRHSKQDGGGTYVFSLPIVPARRQLCPPREKTQPSRRGATGSRLQSLRG